LANDLIFFAIVTQIAWRDKRGGENSHLQMAVG
jgi:hypothetical protein